MGDRDVHFKQIPWIILANNLHLDHASKTLCLGQVEYFLYFRGTIYLYIYNPKQLLEPVN